MKRFFKQIVMSATYRQSAVVTPEGVEWRAGGLLAQFLPDSPERRRHVDFDPGDSLPGMIAEITPEDDEWIEAKSRAATARRRS